MNTVPGVTTPSGLVGTVVVADSGERVDVVESLLPVVVSGEIGVSVTRVSSGATEITFSPLATHALTTIDTANTSGTSLFTAAILGI